MPGTEIDTIFASKSKPAFIDSISSSKVKGKAKANVDQDGGPTTVKKKKKKPKRKGDKSATQDAYESLRQEHAAPIASDSRRERAEPETILDPSVPAAPPKRKKSIHDSRGDEASGRAMKKGKKSHEEEVTFRDSRGTGPRRKTDDGLSIYKEDELGIGDQGGDTPLCPFDCDCCF